MSSASDLQQRAVELARVGDFGQRALEVNLELTRVAPANEGAWTRLARCYMELGQLDEATAALESALRLNPQNTIARSLNTEVERRRAAAAAPLQQVRVRTRVPARSKRDDRASGSGFGRPEFTALGQLAPAVAVEALGPKCEPLLMALNERPFAAKAVETRNRAGRAGVRLFRRNSFHPGSAGHIFAFQYGGRWEPQLNVGLFAASSWQRDSVRAGIGFNFIPGEGASETDTDAGPERVLAYFARCQRLVSGEWRSLLTQWMAANGGFIQYGDAPPATELLPKHAVEWLVTCQNPADLGWIFCGRWLFADRADDAATLADPRKLTAWVEESFNALLPLWSSVFRAV